MRIPSRFVLVAAAILILAACQPSTPVALPTPSVGAPTVTAPAPGVTQPPAGSRRQINGFLNPYGADGEGWPPGVEVTIQVWDQSQRKVLFTRKATPDAQGHFYADVGVATQPGMIIVIGDGQETQSVALVPVAVTAIDLAGDTVSGTAAPGAQVFLFAGDEVDHSRNGWLETTASPAREWQASFAGQYDIVQTTVIQAVVRDANGHGTAFKTGVK